MPAFNTTLSFEDTVKATVKILDERIKEVNDMYNEETGGEDPYNQALMEKVYMMCELCNIWLRMIDTPEEELYDI